MRYRHTRPTRHCLPPVELRPALGYHPPPTIGCQQSRFLPHFMPTITSILDQRFRQAIQAAFNLDADPLVTPTQTDKFGDYQANAAMSLAKTLTHEGQKPNPRQIAEQIKSKLDLADMPTELSN